MHALICANALTLRCKSIVHRRTQTYTPCGFADSQAMCAASLYSGYMHTTQNTLAVRLFVCIINVDADADDAKRGIREKHRAPCRGALAVCTCAYVKGGVASCVRWDD